MHAEDGIRTPGQLVLALMEERGWSKRTLAVILGVSESTITRLTGDKTTVDARLAIVLEELFRVPAERFLSLQKELELAQARIVTTPDPGRATRALLFGDLPVSDMIQRGWLKAESVRDKEAVTRELMRFFGVNRLEDINIPTHASRKSEPENVTPAQIAWLYRVKSIAANMLAPPYSQGKLLSILPKLRELMAAPEESRKVPRLLLEAGVRFLLVENIAAAKIDGVCFWLDLKSPVIGLTSRFDRIDNFWFVLRHEIEHVLRSHGLNEAILDTELEGEKAGLASNIPEEERQANNAAAEFCVSQQKLGAFIERKSPLFSESDLRGFAKLVGVHPGIVAGQLQHKTGRYHIFRSHLVKVRQNLLPSAMTDGWGTICPLGN